MIALSLKDFAGQNSMLDIENRQAVVVQAQQPPLPPAAMRIR